MRPRFAQTTQRNMRHLGTVLPKNKMAKWAILPHKPDPFSLFGRIKKVIVPAGALVFWSRLKVYGVCKNLGKLILWGIYIGCLKYVGRPGYYETCGTHEIDDRFGSVFWAFPDPMVLG